MRKRASENIDEQKKAAAENCKRQAEAIPNGANKDQALEACKRLAE